MRYGLYLVSSSGGGKLGHNLGSAGGSCSDISSIGGADNLAGGRATSSVVSGPSYNPGKGAISAIRYCTTDTDQNDGNKSSYFLGLFPSIFINSGISDSVTLVGFCTF